MGSTGSIGTSTLDVVRRSPDLYRVFALVAGGNMDLLASQIVGVPARSRRGCESDGLRTLYRTALTAGGPAARRNGRSCSAATAARVQAATAPEVDTVISAIVGVAGLEATYEAVCRGKRVGLANKEVLVSAGRLVMDAVRRTRSDAGAGG